MVEEQVSEVEEEEVASLRSYVPSRTVLPDPWASRALWSAGGELVLRELGF